jgi:hypothetical protein
VVVCRNDLCRLPDDVELGTTRNVWTAASARSVRPRGRCGASVLSSELIVPIMRRSIMRRGDARTQRTAGAELIVPIQLQLLFITSTNGTTV